VSRVLVHVELDSLLKIVTVKREDIADTPTVETPMHISRGAPVHPFQTIRRPIGMVAFFLCVSDILFSHSISFILLHDVPIPRERNT
jgi:hypothetical protein